jgi:hypothetical protein
VRLALFTTAPFLQSRGSLSLTARASNVGTTSGQSKPSSKKSKQADAGRVRVRPWIYWSCLVSGIGGFRPTEGRGELEFHHRDMCHDVRNGAPSNCFAGRRCSLPWTKSPRLETGASSARVRRFCDAAPASSLCFSSSFRGPEADPVSTTAGPDLSVRWGTLFRSKSFSLQSITKSGDHWASPSRDSATGVTLSV